MSKLLRVALICTLPVCQASAQEPAFPVPENVKAEGVPSIPLALADAVAQYGEFRSATLLAWHPFDRRILISTTFGNAPQIHEVKEPGGARTQLTFYRDGVTGGAWYGPRGKYFIFRKDTSRGGESMQLLRFDLDTGSTTVLTDGKSRNGEPVFANTRERIAYDSTRRDGRNRDIFVMTPSIPSSDRMLVQLDGNWRVLDWSPDDTQLLVMESISTTAETYLWRVNATTGARQPITTREEGRVRWIDAKFSADGRFVYALGDRGREAPRLWRHVLETRQWSAVTPDADSIETFEESPDGRYLAVVVDRDAMSHLMILDARTGQKEKPVALPPGVISRLSWHPKRAELAFVFAGARTFSDVYSVRVRSTTLHRWTMSESGGANPESLPEAESIQWQSFDGLTISGLLYRPPARFAGPRPVIINIHGGPELRERPRALGRSNYFRNEMGIALIYPNVRGSIGFGRTFESLDDGRKRKGALEDIGALLDWIAAQPDLDKSRVMVTGASYGGYLSLLAAVEYGDRIRCVFEGFGMSDLVSFLESTDESRKADRNEEYGDPANPETREFLQSISPLPHASRLRLPVFIVQGARDTRVPLSQAEALAAALRRNGSPLWYVVYTDAGHMQLTTATNNYNTYLWVMFVERYLLDES